MTQDTFSLDWLITDSERAKANIKHELSLMETHLNQYTRRASNPEEIHSLCNALILKYQHYLQLLDDASEAKEQSIVLSQEDELICPGTSFNRQQLILNLKLELSKATEVSAKKKIIGQIIFYYAQLQKLFSFDTVDTQNKKLQQCSYYFQQLFKQEDLQRWLLGLVDFWEQNSDQNLDLPTIFRGLTAKQRHLVFDFFSKPKLVNLVNAIFFYKLHPELLFKEFIHPEKLISVRTRLGYLFHHIEVLQKQLHNLSLHYGFQPETDYLFHDDELPQGVMIEVDEASRMIVQSVIKELKVKIPLHSEKESTLENVHEMGRAYKFWFNPNNLIDAVMLLQQKLVKKNPDSGGSDILLFHEEMVSLYQKLTTTECLNLYGYFSNKDSRYLLSTLFSINKGHSLDWLPPLVEKEKKAIRRVFEALQCVMEALRVELKKRHVATEPYTYDIAKQKLQAGRRIQKAVLRIINIYGDESINTTRNEIVEQLFRFMEKR